MNTTERKPVKSLLDLKMTAWYASRKPEIQKSINAYPPGYYIFSGNRQVYRLIGWSEPVENRQETVVHLYLERDIPEGTERLRVHPQFVTDEEEVFETDEIQNESTLGFQVESILGYHIGRKVNGEIKYLSIADGSKHCFESIATAKAYLVSKSLCTMEDLDNFLYIPYYEV